MSDLLNGVLGVGIDLCEVDRIEKLISKYSDTFLNKIFTEDEIRYCQAKAKPAMHFAARFAAKEACVKALGTGFIDDIVFTDIAVSHNPLNKPVISLHNKAKDIFDSLNANRIDISLTHTQSLAQAMVIISK